MKNECLLIDCNEYMAGVPDGFFDLAVVDPPYGIDVIRSTYSNRKKRPGKSKADKSCYENKKWDNKIPDKKYFQGLFRVSKNQIILGGNYFIENLYNSSGWIVWNKINGNNDFADCELAWTSFNCAVRIFRFRWSGMLQENMKNKEKRIHPTQKPVALYKWILQKYAQPGWKIFDSHVGSGSIRIACHDLGFDFTGCEIDKDYWQDQEKRYKEFKQGFVLIDEMREMEIKKEELLLI